MGLFILDTNTERYVIKGNPPSVREQMPKIPMIIFYISAIIEAELLHEAACKPEVINRQIATRDFLQRIGILP